MRLKRTNIILALCLVIWASLLYYSFSTIQISTNDKNYEVEKNLNKLEAGLSEQFHINNDMIHSAHKLLVHKKNEIKGSIINDVDRKIPILVFACNRISITKCLDKLILYRPDPDKFPIIVSQVSYNINFRTFNNLFF